MQEGIGDVGAVVSWLPHEMGGVNINDPEVRTHVGNRFTLTAFWAASFFSCADFGQNEDGTEDCPLLIHCGNLAHAPMQARRGGWILKASFEVRPAPS